MLLSRTSRLMLSADGTLPANAWTGGPLGTGATWAVDLALEVQGVVDAGSGFLCDIKAIDAVLERAVAVAGYPARGWFLWLRAVAAALAADMLPAPACRLRLALGKGISIVLDMTPEACMQYTEQYEFSAAHRLHVAALSDEENRALFGKCNNPNGHGHNYVVEVTVALPSAAGEYAGGLPRSLAAAVRREVIDRYDHRHLNLDVADFAERNPTVENIAATVFERLLGTREIGEQLLRVRVHETAKTWAEVSRD